MPTSSELAAIDQQLASRAVQLSREVSAARIQEGTDGVGEVTDRKDEADERMRAEILGGTRRQGRGRLSPGSVTAEPPIDS
jgi:hypothetical protein